jgi:hypothetical protein
MDINAIRSSFKQFIFECGADKSLTEIQSDLYRMLKIRFRSGAPRRPPKIVIVGAPGSGKSL